MISKYGSRIRPWMLKIPVFARAVFAIPFVAVLGVAGYFYYPEFLRMNIFFIVSFVAVSLSAIIFVFWIERFLLLHSTLYIKLHRKYTTAFFLIENGFYYISRKKSQSGSVEKIKFPKVYLKQGKYDLLLYLQMEGNKFQQRFLKLGGELERTFFMDFMDRLDEQRFVAYKMAYSALLNRIHARDVEWVEGRGLKLSKSFYWNPEDQPHLLIAGGTGGGKTVLIREIMKGLAVKGVIQACDPKRADFVPLMGLDVFRDRIFYEKEDIVSCFENAVQIMNNRFDFMRDQMKENDEKEMGVFSKYGFEPYFLICDEMNAFRSSLNFKEREQFEIAETQLILKGRQAGVYLIYAMQKPSSEDLPTKIRSNMMMHISVGKLDDTGYMMMFGDENRNKDFRNITHIAGKRVRGRGYAAEFGTLAQEFYAPLIDKNFNFFDIFEKYPRIENRFDPRENSQNVSAAIKDEKLSDDSTEEVDYTSPEFAPIELPKSKKKVEILTRRQMSERLSEEVGEVTIRQVREIHEALKEVGYTFENVDGEDVLTPSNIVIFQEILEEMNKTAQKAKEVVEKIIVP